MADTWSVENDILYISTDGDMDDYSNGSPKPPWYSYANTVTSAVVEGLVTSIGKYSFCEFRKLVTVEILGNLNIIRNNAFYNCIELKNVNIYGSLYSVGDSVFYGCRKLTDIGFLSGVSSIGALAFYHCTGLRDVIIPNSVTTVGNRTFKDCSNLQSISLSSNISAISLGMFEGCTSLSSITIPRNIRNIYGDAFYGCTALTDVTIPDSVTKIGSSVFRNCTSLTNLIIPDSVDSMDYSVFMSCTSLTNVSLSSNLTKINTNVFKNCDSLSTVILPNKISSIDSGAFENCISLTSVTIPKSVLSIGDNAFNGCTSLTDVEYEGTYDQWNEIQIGTQNEPLSRAMAPQLLAEERRREIDAELARQYHSLTIGAYNTWLNWRLIPTSRPFINPPEVKTNFVEVPGADGSLDFTEALDGKIHYKDREGSWEFLICHEQIDIDTGNTYHGANRWSILYHDILQAIHGKRLQVILMDEWKEGAEDNRFYVGRVWLNSFQSDPHHSKIVFNYLLEPYRYLTTEDAQNRTNGVL